MEHATQIDLIKRVLSHIQSQTTELGDAEALWDVEQYLDEERYAAEVESIFRRQPLIAAHVSQIVRPGDYYAETICDVPVLLVRSPTDGEIHAFLNVCRHRGTRLVPDERGYGRKSFVCPYHAWTYDLDGGLQHVPNQAQSFPNLTCAERGLVELPSETRHGFVWVWLDPEAAGSVEEALGPEIDADFRSFGFGDCVQYRQESWHNQFNWKCGVESFLENYHFSTLHKESTSPIFLNNTGVCDRFGANFRAVAPKRKIVQLTEVPEAEWDIGPAATLLYVIFPNACLFVEKSHASLLQIFPESVDRCRVRAIHVVRHDSIQLGPFWDANIDVFMAAVREDLSICESMHAGFRSGLVSDVVFGRNEVGCDRYRRCVDDQLAAHA